MIKKNIKRVLLFFLAAVTLLMPQTAHAEDTEIYKVNVTGTYLQTEARSMLTLINEFRTEDEAWYWNKTDTEKTQCSDLNELTYDYALEKIAMQRAAEIALNFSHARPNKTLLYTIECDGVRSCGENIAGGSSSLYAKAETPFTAWQETDEYYSGQGHRRNMLGSSYTAVGIAGIKVNGCYYWVQEFGYTNSGTSTTSVNDSSTDVSVEVYADFISTKSVSSDKDSVEIEIGSTADLPSITSKIYLNHDDVSLSYQWTVNGVSWSSSGSYSIYTWPAKQQPVTTDYTWKSNDASIVSVDGNKLKAESIGSTTLTATVLGETVSVPVTVTGASLSGANITLEYDSYTYTGSAIAPAVKTVTLNGKTLTSGTDYTVSYTENVNAGTGTVTITGKGNYKNTASQEFIIAPQNMSNVTIGSIPDQQYTGEAIQPELNLTFQEQTLQKDTDYTAEYHDNTSLGTASVTVTGKGNFTGSVTKEYQITCEHQYTTYISNNDATCTEDGTKTAECDHGCGKTYTVTDVGSALGHSFTNYVSDGTVTCTTDGTLTAKCGRCDATDTKVESATGHSFANYVSNNDASCTTDGTKTATCSKCGMKNTVTDVGSALKHSFTSYKSDGNATCTEDGTKTAKCDHGCGTTDTVTDENSALGHNFTEYKETKIVTCTTDGSKTATCTRCGATDTKTEEALGHSFTNYVSNDDATCTEDGTKTAKCDRCSAVHTVADANSKTGHIEIGDPAKAATCTETGLTEGCHCSVCGKVIKAQTTIAATGHKWDGGEITTEATYSTAGVKTYTCTRCGETKKETVPKLEAPKAGTTVSASGSSYKITDDKSVEYKGTESSVVSVPATVTLCGKSYKVTSIAANAFKNNKKITKVTIGKNVVSIGKNAFSGCTKLKTVTIGSKVTKIDATAFYKCTALTKITIPSKVSSIGKKAFYGCKSLKSISIKTSKLTAKKVGASAFKGIHAKATMKVPKKQLKLYKTIFKKKGINGKKQKIVKL